MAQTQLSATDVAALRKTLLDDKEFLELAKYFIKQISFEEGDDKFKEFYTAALEALATENAATVVELAESPIEKAFLNSFILGSLKGGDTVSVHRTYNDTVKEIEVFRKDLGHFREFVAWFKKNRPTPTMEEFLDGEVLRGKMHQDERDSLSILIFKYRYLQLGDAYHMTIQPPFPSIKIGGKSIRPDIYFWVPDRPEIKIIVECDGFDYHSDKQRFTNDRQRDRALKALGYDVLRFSGSEIYADPVGVSSELATHLVSRIKTARLTSQE